MSRAGWSDWSEKEIAMFDAVDRLINRGGRIHALKVADIAQEAGIGKGTAYEYFRSKEDLLRQAVQFHVLSELDRMETLLKTDAPFEAVFRSCLDALEELTRNRLPGLRALITSLDAAELLQGRPADDAFCRSTYERMSDWVQKLLGMGRRERILADDDPEYQAMVLRGVFTAYLQSASPLLIPDREPEQREQLRAHAWRMLLGAAGPGCSASA